MTLLPSPSTCASCGLSGSWQRQWRSPWSGAQQRASTRLDGRAGDPERGGGVSERRSIEPYLNLSGRLEAYSRAPIYARVSGYLKDGRLTLARASKPDNYWPKSMHQTSTSS